MKKLFLLLLVASFTWSYAQDFDGVVYDATCFASNDGYIDVTVTSEPNGYFEYSWSDGQMTEDAYNLVAGTYTLTVTDILAKGLNSMNYTEQTFIVGEPPVINITIDSQTSPLCPGESNGEISISVTGGTGTYTYAWSAIINTGFTPTTQDVANLMADEYSVIVTDDNACQMELTNIVLSDPAGMEIEITPTDESCFGANDAEIFVFVNEGGGTPEFTYLWSTGDVSQLISNLDIDPIMGYEEFWVTITDANGCTEMTGAMVNAAWDPEYEIATINSNCGLANGEASVEGLEGSFEITWITGEIGDHIYGLRAGLYTVEINDLDMGCSSIKEFYIEDNSGATFTPTVIDASSLTTNDGQISLVISGGTAPHIVVWDNAMISNINPNLYSGSYSATITDADGCLNTVCVPVGYITDLSASGSSTNTGMCSGVNGSATVYPWGGLPPYVFAWDDPSIQTTATANNLTAGIYHCLITDFALNQVTITVAVGDNGGPNISFDTGGIETCGQADGYININASGGTGTLSYLWSNGTTNQNLTNASAGHYQLLVTDQAFPNPCHTAYNEYVQGSMPMEQTICIVTVDSVTNHNLVVWENVQTDGVDHYNIYRDHCDNDFSFVGSVNADAITVFEDITSLPFIKSYSYKISAVDACGNESDLSPVHKTIHLEINLDEINHEAQLIWDDYIGFPNPIFKLYKKTTDLGWVLLSELPSTDFSFVDELYNDTTISYAIIVEKPGGEADACDAWNGIDHASGGPYYQSMSNLEDEGIVNHTQIDNTTKGQFSAYPNPVRGILNIENTETIQSIKIFDLTGKLISSYQNVNQKKTQLNTQNFEAGIYILEIQSSEIIKERIIIE